MIVKDFYHLLIDITEKNQSTIMLLRTVGPDNTSDFDKANKIYSAYHLNLQIESPELFDKLLYNEFVFVEFNDEEEAYNFAVDNLPMNKNNVDSDYFIQFFIFSNGLYAYANDSLESLSDTKRNITI